MHVPSPHTKSQLIFCGGGESFKNGLKELCAYLIHLCTILVGLSTKHCYLLVLR